MEFKSCLEKLGNWIIQNSGYIKVGEYIDKTKYCPSDALLREIENIFDVEIEIISEVKE